MTVRAAVIIVPISRRFSDSPYVHLTCYFTICHSRRTRAITSGIRGKKPQNKQTNKQKNRRHLRNGLTLSASEKGMIMFRAHISSVRFFFFKWVLPFWLKLYNLADKLLVFLLSDSSLTPELLL